MTTKDQKRKDQQRTDPRLQTIIKINDTLRTTFFTFGGHKVVLTPGISESPDKEDIITAVREFNSFDLFNDPHGEHDFGKVTVNNNEYFWKIDYYDDKLEYGLDPYKHPRCRRVLTIMSVGEY